VPVDLTYLTYSHPEPEAPPPRLVSSRLVQSLLDRSRLRSGDRSIRLRNSGCRFRPPVSWRPAAASRLRAGSARSLDRPWAATFGATAVDKSVVAGLGPAGRITVGFPAAGVRKLRASTSAARDHPPTPAIAASRQLAHQRAIENTLKTLGIFVIADVSWQFS
jgi:hypothetical protein